MALGKVDVTLLFVVYAAALIYSTNQIFHLIASSTDVGQSSENYALHVLAMASIAGVSVYYSRKLYKAGINASYNFNPKGLYIQRVSTVAYFLMRIPIAVVFSVVIYASWRISLDIASQSDFIASNNAKYFYLVMGFFSGFSAGRFISYFEQNGLKLSGFSGTSE